MQPFLREMVWGGRRLEQYGKQLPPDGKIGESWELSAYPGMESVVSSGPLVGCSLPQLLHEYGARLLGEKVWDRYEGNFPLLVKLIDANEDLSIQVHPDDAYVRLHDLDRFGKMEAWYVLRHSTGRFATGLKKGTSRSQFEQALEQEKVLDVVEFYDATADQFVFVPPGIVHAACAGVMIYEIQQSSDVTFRLYDYDRVGNDGKPRELHVKQGLEVVDFDNVAPVPVQIDSEQHQKCTNLVCSERFDLILYESVNNEQLLASGDTFMSITVIDGGSLHCVGGDGQRIILALGETALVPAQCAITVRAGVPTKYLVASPPSGDVT